MTQQYWYCKYLTIFDFTFFLLSSHCSHNSSIYHAYMRPLRRLVFKPPKHNTVKNTTVEIARSTVLITSALIIAFLVMAPFFTTLSFANSLSDKENIMNHNDKGLVLFDRKGRVFFSFYSGKDKKAVSLSEIPLHTQHSVIAMEDKNFYSHPGFSLKAIARSTWENFKEKDLAYGGSTITQQLVKSALLNPQKNIARKYQELILARNLEQRFSKDEILEMYLNSVYFGEGAYGIEQAAKVYFNKDVGQLTLAESSLLAAVLPSPSRLSPLSGDINQARGRQKIVLDKMEVMKFISQEEKSQALEEAIQYNAEDDGMNKYAPHFALMVREELERKYGEDVVIQSGFKVTTTLDLDWQIFAEKAVKNQIDNLAGNGATNGAVVVLDPQTGEIRTLVGSKDWHDEEHGKVNVALMPRQPGSSFKPIVYVTAFEKGIITPATILKDSPITYQANQYSEAYRPQNYDRRFRGSVLARRALANSLNVPSVEVLSKVGIPDSLNMAKRLGITTLADPSQYGLALVLGAGEVRLLELTGAYATFANQGVHNQPTVITTIKDRNNRIIYQHTPTNDQVLDPNYAFQISSILSDQRARAEGFGNLLDISRVAAVKTGTSENYRDSWTVGYTPSLAIGVWVGNNDGRPMSAVAGSIGAAPIWRALMEEFLKETPVEQFAAPQTLVAVRVCSYNGLLLQDQNAAAGYTEYFVKGTEPTKICQPPPPPPQPTAKPPQTEKPEKKD